MRVLMFKDGDISGEGKKFARNGVLLLDAQYTDNQYNGLVKEFHENGGVKSVCYYKQGQKEGI